VPAGARPPDPPPVPYPFAQELLACRASCPKRMNENFSLVMMCLFLFGSLVFLADQIVAYH
jgi:hypothetical protein